MSGESCVQNDGEIASLKAELAKMSTAETVAARTLRKTVRTPHH